MHDDKLLNHLILYQNCQESIRFMIDHIMYMHRSFMKPMHLLKSVNGCVFPVYIHI